MRLSRYIAVVFVFAIPSGGCATSPSRPAVAASGAPALVAGPVNSKIVEIFCAPDQVPYSFTEHNVVTVLGWGRDREAMERELRQRAAEQGADAVVMLDEQRTSGTSLDYSEGSCSIDSMLLRGIAITYDEDDDGGRQPAATY